MKQKTIIKILLILTLTVPINPAVAASKSITCYQGVSSKRFTVTNSLCPAGWSSVKPTMSPYTEGLGAQYTLAQAVSDQAQLSTIAFSGLAFITGNAGADTFMPPGKVADFFGFQYMRDVDIAGYGHNTTYLSRVANNVISILSSEQKNQLIALAKIQAPQYASFAYNRLPLMIAFRRTLNNEIPTKSKGLSIETSARYTAALYKTDAELSYNRALIVGKIVRSFSDSQKSYLAKMDFNNYKSWPDISENQEIKRGLTNPQYIAVMTYASELFSWYKGNLYADVYFCPERHGTYFGGFFMKDFPAMDNPDYFISTALTGDLGAEFLKVLNPSQQTLITSIIKDQSASLKEIIQIRTAVSTELRKAMIGDTLDKAWLYAQIQRYGELDGKVSALYASRFAAVNQSLSQSQRDALIKLRNLTVVPKGIYNFSTLVPVPALPNTDFFFGVDSIPSTAGQLTAPAGF